MKYFLTIFLILIPSIVLSFPTEGDADYKKVAPKKNERCIICDVPLTEEDFALMVRGRRVPLKAAMFDSFMNNQEKYFSKLQPKSALFQENMDAPAGVAQGGVSMGWFWFGVYVLVGLIFGGMTAYTAVAKGLSAVPHFFIGFFLPVIGFAYVMSRPSSVKKGEIPDGLVKVPTTSAPEQCPKCNYTNHPSATACAGCGAELQPEIASEVSKVLK